MDQLSELNQLFLNQLKDKVSPLYKELISHHVVNQQEADLETQRFYEKRRPGLQDVYSRYAEHWDALREIEGSSDTDFSYLVQKYTRAFAKYYDSTDLGVDYYLDQWRKYPRSSREWQTAREQFTDRWERLLSDREYAWQMEYVDRLVEEYYRMVQNQVGMIQNQGYMGIDSAPRMSWLASKQDPELRERLFTLTKIMLKNPIAKDMLQRLGRNDGVSNQLYVAQRARTMRNTIQHAGQSDIVGIREGSGMQNILPGELSQLADSELENGFLSRLADGHLQIFDSVTQLPEHAKASRQKGQQVSNPSGKGPFVVCCDCSGSMMGNPEDIAKALVLTAAIATERQDRLCRVILFSDQITELEFHSLSQGMEDLSQFLCGTFHGGTDAELAITHALDTLMLDEFSEADFLLLSDCQMPKPPVVLHQRILDLKERGTRFYTIAFGSYPQEYYIDIADHYWTYR